MPAKIEIDKEEFLKLVNEGETINQLANHFNCSPRVINSRKSKWNIAKKYGSKKDINKEKFTSLLEKGYTNEQLSKHFNCSVGPIKSLKRELNLTTFTPINKIDINNDKLIELVDIGYSLEELAKYFNCLPLVISHRKEDLGLCNSSKVYVDNDKLENLVSLGFTAENIAEKLSCSPNIIINRKKELGIKYVKTQGPKNGITKDFILTILDFSDESFPRWKERRGSVTTGNIAGTINNNGQRIVEINDIAYNLSHLVILIHEGILPIRKVFHLNMDLLDNSYDNLKIAELGSDYFKRRAKQTPKNVNTSLMAAIWKYCPKEWHVDHIQPLSKGGLNEPNNLQYLTQEDNLKKGNKIDYTYITKPIRWQDRIKEEYYRKG